MGYKDDDFWTLDKLVPKKAVYARKDIIQPADSLAFAHIKQEGFEEKSKEIKIEQPVFVSVPKTGQNEEKSFVTKRIEFPESHILVSAEISSAMSYSMRESGFLKSAVEAESLYPNEFIREDLPFDGTMTEREKDIHVPIYTVMPVFRDMGKSQKRWYEYWKSHQIKKHKIDTESAYFYLYIAETVNFCEASLLPPEEALERMIWLAENYCGDDSGVGIMLRRVLTDVIFDLVISKELEFPTKELSEIFDDRFISSRPLLCSVYIADHILANECYIKELDKEKLNFVFRYVSDHDHTKSKYYLRDPYYAELADKCFSEAAPHALMEDYNNGNKTGESSPMISASLMTTTRRLYPGVMMDTSLTRTVRLEHYPVFTEPSFRAASGALFKYIENKVRGIYGVKNKLSGVNINETRRKTVDEYFYPLEAKLREERISSAKRTSRKSALHEYEENQGAKESLVKGRTAEDIVIDTEKASLIEESSWETTVKLMDGVEIEEDSSGKYFSEEYSVGNIRNETDSEEKKSDEADFDEFDGFVKSLTDEENLILRLLYLGKVSEARNKAEEKSTFLQAVTESINDKAVNTVGDIIIDDEFTVIEEYREELFERMESHG